MMSEVHKQVTQHPRQRCYFCGSEGPIETHHVVPRRHSGSDDETNLVDLCPTCHERLERLYDKRFYQELGVAPEETTQNDETSREQRQRIQQLKKIICEIEKQHEEGAPRDLVIAEIEEQFDSIDKPLDEINKLRRKGKVYEPKQNHFRTT